MELSSLLEHSPTNPLWELEWAFQNDFAYVFYTLAVIFGFVLAFAVGANDSANSWGTPIGAGTISLRMAFLLGFIFETLGALFLSSGVISTIAGKGSVVNMNVYEVNETAEWINYQSGDPYFLMSNRQLMVGFFSSMVASQAWQLVATYFSWPVSGTHAIISALFGFTLVEKGFDGVNPGDPNPFKGSGIYKVLYGILVSPPIALVIGFLLYGLVYKVGIANKSAKSLTSRIVFSSTFFVMIFTIGFQMANAHSITAIESYPVLLADDEKYNSYVFGLIVGAVAGLIFTIPFHFFALPRLISSTKNFYLSFGIFRKGTSEKKTDVKMEKIGSTKSLAEIESSEDGEEEDEQVANVFRPLQVCAACFAAFNHGGNDVGNCIGPLVTIYVMYAYPLEWLPNLESNSHTSWKLWGGFGIGLGLIMFGERVITTMGSKITPMTPSLGFVVVISSNFVLMLCTLMGIPTSTTQCQVMALVGAGIARGWVDSGSFGGGVDTVNISVFKRIVLAWVITIFCSGGLSMALYSVLRIIFINSDFAGS